MSFRTKVIKRRCLYSLNDDLPINFTIEKPYDFKDACTNLGMWIDHLFWLIFNDIAYRFILVVIISKSRLIYTFKKLPSNRQKGVEVKIFFKNFKSERIRHTYASIASMITLIVFFLSLVNYLASYLKYLASYIAA